MGRTNTSPEGDVVLLTARRSLTPENRDRLRFLLGQPLDWGQLISFAARHRVLPLLCRHILPAWRNEIPEDAQRVLQEHVRWNAHRNLLRTAELIEILRDLEEQGIQASPYKGPVLADLLYGDVSLRHFDDLDVFVRMDDVQAAKRV